MSQPPRPQALNAIMLGDKVFKGLTRFTETS